ncbi:MAG: dicarboxylate/amino acid:cation symporter [Polymorphobacter sp.]|uniref:dicarboxylate/amino acid:cation symporter n=1 Tax=Polymorphobacter sp. TaxID=1909290 RepID=UPI003A87CE5E
MTASSAPARSPKILLSLVVGLVLGALVGVLLPTVGAGFEIFGLAFVQAIKMIVIPLIFSAVTLASYRLGASAASMGRLSLLAFGWFFFATFVAAMIGLTLDRIVQPGLGAQLQASGDAAVNAVQVNWRDFWLGLIPSNIIAAMAAQKILPTLIFAVLFGVSLASIGPDKARPIVALLESLFEAIFRLTGWIVRLAPFAVFAVAAWFAATQSFAVVVALGKLVALMYLGMVIVLALCIAALALLGRGSPDFLRRMVPPVLLGFATRSSEVALPLHMEKLVEAGIDRRIVSTVLPLGYSFNLDGAALYMGLMVPFLAEAYGMTLDLAALATILVTILIASKGIANVPGGSMVAAAGVVLGLGLPAEAVAIMAGVDIFLDMGRTAVNVFGNTCAAAFVDRFVTLEDESPEARARPVAADSPAL